MSIVSEDALSALIEGVARIETQVKFAVQDIKRLDGKLDQAIDLITAQEGRVVVLEEEVRRNKKKSVGYLIT